MDILLSVKVVFLAGFVETFALQVEFAGVLQGLSGFLGFNFQERAGLLGILQTKLSDGNTMKVLFAAKADLHGVLGASTSVDRDVLVFMVAFQLDFDRGQTLDGLLWLVFGGHLGTVEVVAELGGSGALFEVDGLDQANTRLLVAVVAAFGFGLDGVDVFALTINGGFIDTVVAERLFLVHAELERVDDGTLHVFSEGLVFLAEDDLGNAALFITENGNGLVK